MHICSSHYFLKRNTWKAICLLAYLLVFITGSVFAQSQLGDAIDAESTGLIFENGFERDPTAVAITSFSAIPDVITMGGSTTLSWTTENAVSCTPSGGTGGWDVTVIGLPNGNALIEILSAGVYTFTLTCQDAESEIAIRDLSVTVTITTPSCDPSLLSGSVVDWVDQWGTAFPGPTYLTINIALPRYGYHAIKFNTGQVYDDGRVLGIENTNTTGIVYGAISECPGDFNVVQDCQYKWGLGGSIDWSTNNSPYSCELVEDTTYYLNLTFTDGDNPEETTCTSNLCNATMQHRNY